MERKPREEEIDMKQQFVPLAQRGFKEGEFGEQPMECTFTPSPRHRVCYWFRTRQ